MVQEACQCGVCYPCRCSCLSSRNTNLQPWQGLKSQYLCSCYSCDWPVLPFFISCSKPLPLPFLLKWNDALVWCVSNSCSWALWRWGSGLLMSCVYKEKEKAEIMSQIVVFSQIMVFWLKGTLTMKKPSWLGSSSSPSQGRFRCVFSLARHLESASFYYSYWCKTENVQWLQPLLFRDIINQKKTLTLLTPAPEVIGCSKAWISWVPLTIFPVSLWEQ